MGGADPPPTVGGVGVIPLFEAARGEDVEVAVADTEEGGSKDESVVGNEVEEDPLCAWKKQQIFSMTFKIHEFLPAKDIRLTFRAIADMEKTTKEIKPIFQKVSH